VYASSFGSLSEAECYGALNILIRLAYKYKYPSRKKTQVIDSTLLDLRESEFSNGHLVEGSP